jgi:hypothetical protein
MKFDVPEVKACLVKNGEVYTVRSFESRDRFTVVPVNNLPFCMKEKICKIESYKDLTRYTHLSGFKSPLEWWRKIEEMKAQDGWLYRVSVLEEESFESPFYTITFTGNRNISAGTVQEALQAVHEKYPNTTWRTGMAYGLDMAVAEFADANGIPFEAHLPFPAYIQTKRWNPANQARHLELLEKAVKVFTYSQEFSMAGYQLRNVKMADGADIVVAFNRNKRGGTVNMVSHCIDSGIPVLDGYSLSFLPGAAQS